MSRRQMLQSGEGILLEITGLGILQYASKSAPVGGEKGYAPGCEWFVPAAGTGTYTTGTMYVNIGNNGLPIAGTDNPTALWIESDPSSAQQVQVGGSSATLFSSGNVFQTILTVANGKSPSATGVFKIVDRFILPANALNKTGRGFQWTVWGTAAANGNNKQFQIVANPTNVAGFAIDGTITLTGGTAIGDTGVLTTNNGGLILQAQLFKTGAVNSNTQESMTTAIVGGGTHGGCGAWTDATLAENAAITIVVVAKATTTASDIVYQGSELTWYNA